MKKLLKWGGIGLIALIVVAVITGSGSDSKKVGSNTDTTNTKTTTENSQPSQETYKVGDKVQMGELFSQ
jgi:hypothetical protein